MLEIIEHGTIREIRLARPPANALNGELVDALDAALSEAALTSQAVIVSGGPGMFCAGLDVPELITLDRKDFSQMWSSFVSLMKTIACMPVPTVFALTGHAPAGGLVLALMYRSLTWQKVKESVFLTAKATAMVCWLFVGSWTFSSVFSYLGGHMVIEEFVMGLNLSPVMFLILAQIIIFLLGWPLEWSEIIIIFVPIFLPLLDAFNIDPLFFGILVAFNLQTSFLTPPMAMSCYYLKGISPPHIQLTTIFKGSLPFLAMVLIAMVILYNFPVITTWLPSLVYGRH